MEPPIAQEVVHVFDEAVMAGSEREAQGEAGSCHQQGLIVQQMILHVLTPTHSDENYSKGLGGFVWSRKLWKFIY